jgi:hypothetical protein
MSRPRRFPPSVFAFVITSCGGGGEATEGGSETGGDDHIECGEWSSLETRARGLDKVWTDGTDIIAVGEGDIVKRSAGAWTNLEPIGDALIYLVSDVWGPTLDDHWLLADTGVLRFDGTRFNHVASFTEYPPEYGSLRHHDLSGSAPDNLWATATLACENEPSCMGLDCPCALHPSLLLHYDGTNWGAVTAPGLITQIWTDGTSTWGVGGREETPELMPIPGIVASHDGSDWTVWSDGELPPLYAVWATSDDDVWVGGEAGTLRRLESGMWVDHDLPTEARVMKIEGRTSDEAWALDADGQLWSWDGISWAPAQSIPGARDFVVANDELVVVGSEDGEFGHVITGVDVELDATEVLYHRRGDVYPEVMLLDGLHDGVASSPDGFQWLGLTGSWHWDGSDWTPTHVDAPGFAHLLGHVDQGYAVNQNSLYQIVDGEVVDLVPPEPGLIFLEAELVMLGDEEQLWISGYDNTDQNFLYALESEVWVDRWQGLPPSTPVGVRQLTHAGNRVFAEVVSDNFMFEAGTWTSIGSPAPGQVFQDFVATGAEELWVTVYVDPAGFQLYFWDGAEWHYGPDTWPVLDGYRDWWHLEAVAPDDLWMVSSKYSEPEDVAHWNGSSWTVLDTPELLHGWSERQSLLVEGVPEGVLIHDGIRLWTYERCSP